MALLAGSGACAGEDRQEDANYLQIIGYVRGMVDVAVLSPTEAGLETAARIYRDLHFNVDAAVDLAAFFRDPAVLDPLEQRVRATELPLTAGYHPGWSYRQTRRVAIYADAIAWAREERLWQMRVLALRLQDDDYFEAYLAFFRILQENNGIRPQGTATAAELDRLEAQMIEAEKDIPSLPRPPLDLDLVMRLAAPDSEVALPPAR